MSAPEKFANVTAVAKANVFFDGKVVSHAIFDANGGKITLGVIFPGTFNFTTAAPERMDITAGSCRVRLAGEKDFAVYAAGSHFNVPANSSFDITVDQGLAEYICTFG